MLQDATTEEEPLDDLEGTEVSYTKDDNEASAGFVPDGDGLSH